jgi:hypothetical protein
MFLGTLTLTRILRSANPAAARKVDHSLDLDCDSSFLRSQLIAAVTMKCFAKFAHDMIFRDSCTAAYISTILP